ncbi:MAG: hypothetical protein AB7U95_09685 [Reyranella sp.]
MTDKLTVAQHIEAARAWADSLRDPDRMPGYEHVTDAVAEALDHLAAAVEQIDASEKIGPKIRRAVLMVAGYTGCTFALLMALDYLRVI